LAGGIIVWAVVGSPLAHLDHHLLIAHMVQHLLLMTVAAPLILLGTPAASIRLRVARHPIACWLAGTAVVMWWHIPFAFELGMQSARWHAFEQITFLVAGLLFWSPVIQPWQSLRSQPRWNVPLYLFLATLPCDALSAFLAFCGHPVYRSYLNGSNPFGMSAMQDQACAGALMWVWVTFAYLIPAVGITMRILSPQPQARGQKGYDGCLPASASIDA
jgi:cytochrome c oxidase assembly factor CtaG